jgi:hypothetical protein
MSDIANDLLCSTKVVFSIIDGFTSSDHEFGTDKQSCAGLPDGNTCQFVRKTRLDLNKSFKENDLENSSYKTHFLGVLTAAHSTLRGGTSIRNGKSVILNGSFRDLLEAS